MSEILLKEQIELDRKRDDFARLDRINGVERDHAVLRTRFDLALKWFEEALERAVSGDDLKKLKREMEDELKQTTSAIYEHFKTANDQQAQSILGQVKDLFGAYRNEQTQEQLKSTNAVLKAITERRSKAIWWVLGIIGSIVISVASTLIVVAILGRPD